MKGCRFFLVVIVWAISQLAFAQEPIIHVVVKGETVSSIARKYNISEADLIDENPILKNYIYVGMKVRVPGVKAEQETPAVAVPESAVSTTEPAVTAPAPVVQQDSPTVSKQEETPAAAPVIKNSPVVTEPQKEEVESTDDLESRWYFMDKVGYYMDPDLKKQEGVYQSFFNMAFSVGGGYKFSRFFALEGQIGYSATYSLYDSRTMGIDTATSTSSLLFGQHACFTLPVGQKSGLVLTAGTEENLFLTGTIEDKKAKTETKIKPKDRFSGNYGFGARLLIYGFYLGADYKVGFNEGALWGFCIGYMESF